MFYLHFVCGFCFVTLKSVEGKFEKLRSKGENKPRMDPEQIILDEDFDDGSTDGGYGEYDYLQQDKDALPVTPLGEFPPTTTIANPSSGFH